MYPTLSLHCVNKPLENHCKGRRGIRVGFFGISCNESLNSIFSVFYLSAFSALRDEGRPQFPSHSPFQSKDYPVQRQSVTYWPHSCVIPSLTLVYSSQLNGKWHDICRWEMLALDCVILLSTLQLEQTNLLAELEMAPPVLALTQKQWRGLKQNCFLNVSIDYWPIRN